MKKIFFLIFIGSTFLLQSCFEIIEQVYLKNDGSGNFVLTLNLSKSKTKLNSISKMKTVNGRPVPSQQEIKDKLTKIEQTIAKTSGISNVKTTLNFDNYIATISCNFNNVTQLNSAVKNIYAVENSKLKNVPDVYGFNTANKTFSRYNKFQVKGEYNKLSNADKEIFATANFTAIYKFENEVIATSNKTTKVAPSKKATMLKQNILDIITEKKSIENTINFSQK